MVWVDRDRYIMQANNYFDVDLSQPLRSVGSHNRDEMRWFFHPIHNDTNGIKLPQGRWQSYHKVYSDELPLPLSYINIMKQTTLFLMLILDLLTVQTTWNIPNNFLLHPCTLIILLQNMIHLRSTWVNRISWTMNLLKNKLSQAIDISNTRTWSRNTQSSKIVTSLEPLVAPCLYGQEYGDHHTSGP